MENTYWASKGKYTDLYNKLNALIPAMGDCAKQGKALEKLRVAGNSYYDLYNNGLCNRAAEFRKVFGFGGTPIAKLWGQRDRAALSTEQLEHALACERKAEEKLDQLILAAAKEQLIVHADS